VLLEPEPVSQFSTAAYFYKNVRENNLHEALQDSCREEPFPLSKLIDSVRDSLLIGRRVSRLGSDQLQLLRERLRYLQVTSNIARKRC
jgi:hypothetical protein